MKKGYYITADVKKVNLSPQLAIDVSNRNIVELVVPEGTKYVWGYNNNLTKLNLPEGIEDVYCYNNKLTELILPNRVEKVVCDIGVKLINYNKEKTNVVLLTE